MTSPKKCIATKVLLLASAFATSAMAWAGTPVGTVTDLAGALLAKKADGTVKILSQKSNVEQGDTLVTEKDTYARIKFIDNGEITLKPNSQFRIDKFSYEESKKESDSAVFSLIRGGLRSVTGLVGKRSQDRFGVNTPAATIGIRGTTFIAEYIPEETDSAAAAAAAAAATAATALYAMASVASIGSNYTMPAAATDMMTMSDVPYTTVPVRMLSPMAQLTPSSTRRPTSASGNGLAPGLHLAVTDGQIIVSNPAGAQNFTAGQFGYTRSITISPVLVPNNPLLQFSPPAIFNQSTVTNPTSVTGGLRSLAVECEVR